MIKRLRLKFIAIMMGVLIVVFTALFLMLNIFMRQSSERQTEKLLQTIADQDGLLFPPRMDKPRHEPRRDFPPMQNPEMMRDVRYFYVKADNDGGFFEINFEMMLDFTRDEAFNYAQSVLKQSRKSGTIDNLQYLIAKKDYGNIIVFAQRNIETGLLTQLIYVSAYVAGGTFLILFVFSIFLSKWAVNPVRDAFEKQRRFVTDASHELKTPLTIISANTDVLENEIGSNMRLAHIRIQSERMGALIQDLLTLAKLDESNAQIVATEFDLSRAIRNTVLEFESRVFEEGKKIFSEVENDIVYSGDEKQIRQLASILIDNAIRHSDRVGEIKITLKKDNGHLYLAVYNTGEGISKEEREKIFDRFYRSDASRSRETGGYGLGLAIAKSIVDTHKGKITVTGQEGEWIEFGVSL